MNKEKIILDVDTGVDDSIALACALSSDKVEVLGVTTVHGNTDIENTTRNTLNILNLLGRPDIPVAKGEGRPLVRNTVFKAAYAHGEKGLCGVEFDSDASAALSDKHACEFMRDLLSAQTEKVTICLLGAATNAALLLRKYPSVKDKIKSFVFMGGSYDSGTATPVVSVNVYYDPEALQQVIHSGVPFYMATMDATTKCCLLEEDFAFLRTLKSERAKTFLSMLESYTVGTQVTAAGRYPGMPMHDPAAVISIYAPELYHYTKYRCEVELDGEITYGMTVIYKNGFDGVELLPDGSTRSRYVSEDEKNIWYMDAVDNRAVIEEVKRVFAQL